MKIALINTYANGGGAAIACNRLHKALYIKGVKSNIIVQDTSTCLKRGAALLRLIIEKIYFLFYEKNSAVRFKMSLANTGVNISNNIQLKNADIIHLHWVNNGFFSLHSIKQLAVYNKPIVWTLHDMWAFTGGCHHSRHCSNYKEECGQCIYLKRPKTNDLSHKIWLKKCKIYSKLKLTIVTPSYWLANCAKQSLLLKNMPIIVIPNPIDTNLYNIVNKIEARKKLNLPINKHIITFIAANISDPRKGYCYIQEALQLLHEQYPELKNKIILLLIGREKKATLIDLPYNYVYTGYIDNENIMAQYYAASNAFITTSLEENLPNTIMEALSCGTPTIGFNIGGIAEMIDHQKNGYLVKYKDIIDLAKGIYWIITEANQESLSQNARKKVIEKYNQNIVANQYINLYSQLISPVSI